MGSSKLENQGRKELPLDGGAQNEAQNVAQEMFP